MQLLMADSTNSEVPGHTISESYIIDNLTILFQKARGRIFFSTFASNVHRFLKVIELAAQFQRKVVIIGRSIERIVNIIRDLGHLQINHDVFMNPDDLEQLPPEKTLVLCTGSQGEPNAALARIARGHLKYVKMQRDDLVLLSSSAIPGNRLAIELLVNDLVKKGAQVLQNTADFPIHTSGHAAKEDQKLMFMLTKPRFFMPIHGDFRMMKAHGQTATEVNVAPDNIFYCSNGDVVYLYQNYAWIGDRVNAEPVYIDNNNRNIDDRAQTLVAERLSLASRGFLTIVLVFSGKCQLLVPPVIISRGSFFVQKSGSLMFKLKKSILSFIEQYFKNNNVIHQQFSEDLKNLVSGIVFRAQKRNPVILPVTITTPVTSG